MTTQKLKKLTRDPNFNAFKSGELAVSMRYVFEHMHRSGLTSQLEAVIKKKGIPPITADDIATHFTRLSKQGVNLSSEVKQSITNHLTENAQGKSEAFTNLVNKHGLWVVHDGIYDLTKRVSGMELIQTGQQNNQDVATKPVNPKLAPASTLSESVKGGTLEPMLSCDGDGDGDGDACSDGGGDGVGDGDGGDGDGGGTGQAVPVMSTRPNIRMARSFMKDSLR